MRAQWTVDLIGADGYPSGSCNIERVLPENSSEEARGRLSTDGSFRDRKAKVIQDFQRDYLTMLLSQHGGNISAAARSAKKNRRAFWQLLRKHGLVSRIGRGARKHSSGREPAAPISIVAVGAGGMFVRSILSIS